MADCEYCALAKERLSPAGWKILEKHKKLEAALKLAVEGLNSLTMGMVGTSTEAYHTASKALKQIEEVLNGK
jgi:biotin synthase-related radical SAM superfamily protein